MEQKRHKEEIQGVKASLQRTKYLRFSGVMLLGLKGGWAGESEEPVEKASKCHQVVSGVNHADGRDGGPGEERRHDDGDAGKQEALQSRKDGRVLDVYPSELEGGPDADKEGSIGTEEECEAREERGIVDRGREEEGKLGGEEGGPDRKKGSGSEAERVEEVGKDEANREDGEDGSTAEVEEKGSGGDEGESEAGVMGEGGGRDEAALGSGRGGRGGGGRGGGGGGGRRAEIGIRVRTGGGTAGGGGGGWTGEGGEGWSAHGGGDECAVASQGVVGHHRRLDLLSWELGLRFSSKQGR